MMYFIRLAYLFIIDSHGIVPFRMQTVMSRAPSPRGPFSADLNPNRGSCSRVCLKIICMLECKSISTRVHRRPQRRAR